MAGSWQLGDETLRHQTKAPAPPHLRLNLVGQLTAEHFLKAGSGPGGHAVPAHRRHSGRQHALGLKEDVAGSAHAQRPGSAGLLAVERRRLAYHRKQCQRHPTTGAWKAGKTTKHEHETSKSTTTRQTRLRGQRGAPLLGRPPVVVVDGVEHVVLHVPAEGGEAHAHIHPGHRHACAAGSKGAGEGSLRRP
jgi:hypothetical protein